MFEAIVMITVSSGAAVGIVLAVRPFVLEMMRERTRQLQAEAQPAGQLTERWERIEARLADIDERQQQLQATQDWQQQLLEQPERDGQAAEDEPEAPVAGEQAAE